MNRTFSDLEIQMVLDDLYALRKYPYFSETEVSKVDDAIDVIRYLYDIKKKVHNICQESN